MFSDSENMCLGVCSYSPASGTLVVFFYSMRIFNLILNCIKLLASRVSYGSVFQKLITHYKKSAVFKETYCLTKLLNTLIWSLCYEIYWAMFPSFTIGSISNPENISLFNFTECFCYIMCWLCENLWRTKVNFNKGVFYTNPQQKGAK